VTVEGKRQKGKKERVGIGSVSGKPPTFAAKPKCKLGTTCQKSNCDKSDRKEVGNERGSENQMGKGGGGRCSKRQERSCFGRTRRARKKNFKWAPEGWRSGQIERPRQGFSPNGKGAAPEKRKGKQRPWLELGGRVGNVEAPERKPGSEKKKKPNRTRGKKNSR